MKTPIIGTGISGLVGSRVVELLDDEFEFTDLSLATGVDITEFDQVIKSIEASSAKVVLHMAAKTDVDSCEDDKILGEEGLAWRVNVEGTQNIVDAAKKLSKRIIYISTDFVFDGTKEFYTEDDLPNPLNWYGCTKYEAEKRVKNSGVSFSIIRIASPYRSFFKEKVDFVRKIIESLKQNGSITVPTDHIFTPTFIDDIAGALKIILKKEIEGVFHGVGNKNLSPYEAAKRIMELFGLNGKIETTTRDVYFKGRAFRPFKLALRNDKITKLGIQMRDFDEGLLEFKRQLTQI